MLIQDRQRIYDTTSNFGENSLNSKTLNFLYFWGKNPMDLKEWNVV